MRDIHNSIEFTPSLANAAVTATANGTSIDLAGAEAAEVIIDAGTVGGTTPVFTVEVQESDASGSGFAEVAAGDLLGGSGELTIDAANDAQIHTRGYIGNKRYLRVAVTAVSGTSPTIPLSAVVMQHRLRHLGGPAV